MSSRHQEAAEFIERMVPQLMEEAKVPGLSVAVTHEGETIYEGAFGSRDVGRSLPATPDTLYGIGSVTKSFVALAIMQLAEEGRLSLGDPASDHIPLTIGFPDDPVTIRSLLTHSSGIPALGTSTIALHRGIGIDTWIPWGTAEDFYRHVNAAQEEVAAPPGRRFFYFNAGYRMLGHVIQAVSGKRFDEYITESILRPLGMGRSTLSKAEYLEDGSRMTPYRRGPDGELIPTEFPYPNVGDNPDFAFMAAAGGIISTVRDLARYLEMNINGGTLDGRRLLSPESMGEMHTLHAERPPNHYGRHGYGYGWGVTEDFLGTRMVSHGGSILVSTAHVAFLPRERVGVAMASNISGFPYEWAIQGILATLMGRDPHEAVPALRMRRKMRLLEGRYEIYRGLSKAEVVNRGGLLHLIQRSPLGDVTVPLIPEDDGLESNRFYVWSMGVRQPVEFVVDAPDRIDMYVERNRYHKVG